VVILAAGRNPQIHPGRPRMPPGHQ